MRLIDRYRPRTWAEFVGNEKAILRVRRLVESGDFDRGAFWVTGPTGIGKSALAEIICRELGVDPRGPDCLSYNGHTVSRAIVDELAEMIRYYPMSAYRVIIVNEAHQMSRRAVDALHTLLDHVPPRHVWIFTTTEPMQAELFGGATEPLLGRCTPIVLSKEALAPAVIAHLRRVADLEGINGKTDNWYRRTVESAHNSIRASLQALELER